MIKLLLNGCNGKMGKVISEMARQSKTISIVAGVDSNSSNLTYPCYNSILECDIDVDVILDFGCWVRIQRDEYRLRAEQLGTEFKTHYLDTPKQMLLSGLVARNANLPSGTFYTPETKLEEWFRIFEPLFSEELPYTLIYRVDEQNQGCCSIGVEYGKEMAQAHF